MLLLVVGVMVSVIDAQRVEESCSDFLEDGYHCVPIYLCINNTIVTDGSNLITIRTDEVDRAVRAMTASCPKLIEVCCRLKKKLVEPDQEDGVDDILDNIFTDGNDIKTSQVEETIKRNQRDSVFGPKPRCGVRNVGGVDLTDEMSVKEDLKALFGEWPHVCMIIKNDQADLPNYIAGASLLDSNIILTAASKLISEADRPEDLLVRCGEWDTRNRTEPRPHMERRVSKVVIHPDFKNQSLFNNFAVIFLEEPFEFADHVQPVCAPQPGKEFPPETECYFQGWGKNTFDGERQNILKDVPLPLVDRDVCQQRLRKTRLTAEFKLNKSFICAGGQKGKDACTGDGGSPLVCRQPGTTDVFIQVGIVSWGIDCGKNDTPGVYANLPEAMCWIDAVVSCHRNIPDSAFGFTESDCRQEASTLGICRNGNLIR